MFGKTVLSRKKLAEKKRGGEGGASGAGGDSGASGAGGDGGAIGIGGPKSGEQRNYDWKSLTPADDTATVTVDGLEYFYFSSCG